MGAGKRIGGIIGFMVGGPSGALAGYTLGLPMDFGNGPADDTIAYGNEHAKEDVFAGQQNSFLLLILVMASYIARADGRIIYNEAEYVRSSLWANFGVAIIGEGKRILLSLFEQRKHMNIQNPLTFRSTIHDCDMQIAANLTYEKCPQLLGPLANITRSDNNVYREEIEALKEVAVYIGLSEKKVESMLNSGGNSLDTAHKILEIDPIVTDEEARATYRKLISEHHPGRVVTLGEGVKCTAEEKLQSINDAKEIIYKARGVK